MTSPTILKKIATNFNAIATSDRWSIIRQWQTLKKQWSELDHGQQQSMFQKLQQAIELSKAKVAERRETLPTIDYPDLPIAQKVSEIKRHLQKHNVIIVAGETGSGKSTQLPKLCLEMGLGAKGMIAHTQPRRIAARSVAQRLADEIKQPLGQQIGYKVRFSDQTSEQTLVKVMTDGMLLAETQQDKFFDAYEVIIIDEAHERSLNIDFLLGHLKQILVKRPNLKVIITSATIDHQRFCQHFNNAPLVEVSGRTYPVDIVYQPPSFEGQSQNESIYQSLIALSEYPRGDVLIFLPTERDIHETADYLRKQSDIATTSQIIPLYARLSNQQQQRIFSESKTAYQRIVLSTNVAETSLTVPGIRYVIDTGLVRMSRYSYRTKVQRLPIEPISQASANQRAGRCGRLGPGVCIRLYSQEDFDSRASFTDPEILRTNLAFVILQMMALKLGHIEQFPFIDPPDSRFIKDGYRLLYELGATNKATGGQIKINQLGRQMAKFPLDPRFARMLIEAVNYKALQEVLVIVSFLSIQDPRERPTNQQQKALSYHQQDADKQSDLMTIINLWQRYHQASATMSRKQQHQYCQTQFLSPVRMREWRSVYSQLKTTIQQQGWSLNQQAAQYEQIHQSVLPGLLSYIGYNHELHEYLGPRGIKFYIYPGSNVFKSKPKWLCAAEIVETSKLYARNVAKIQPDWIEKAAKHLVKYHYQAAHWSQKQQQVLATERVTLYGLVLANDRKKPYHQVNPIEARQILIQSGLIEGQLHTQAGFLQANRAQLANVEALEDKARRRDIVIDEQTLYDYYDQLIPEGVYSGVTFQQWYQQLSHSAQKQLYFDQSALMQHDATAVTATAYPDYLQVNGLRLPLSYHFDPTASDDGVTITIPAALRHQVNIATTTWLVPGLLEEKITALLKSLPKNKRKACVPVPQYVQALMNAFSEQQKNMRLTLAIAEALTRMTGQVIDQDDFNEAQLPLHLQMRFVIVDEQGNLLASGRDWQWVNEQIKQGHNQTADTSESSAKPKDPTVYDAWTFGNLPKTQGQIQYGIEIETYPCVQVQGQGVVLADALSQQEWQHHMHLGVRQLLIKAMGQQRDLIKQQLNRAQTQLSLKFAMVPEKNWQSAMLNKIFDWAFHLPSASEIRTQAEFNQLKSQGASQLSDCANQLIDLMGNVMGQYQSLSKKLKTKKLAFDLIALYQQCQAQLDCLIYPGFIEKTPIDWLKRYPKYLQAIELRLEKAPRQLGQDREYQQSVQHLQTLLSQQVTKQGLSEADPLVQKIRWLIQELWLSFYAQHYKTLQPVSVKRLTKQIHALSS